MMDKRTLQTFKHRKNVFCSVRSLNDLSILLRTDKRKLEIMSQQPQYKSFTIPKRDGGKRYIEAPTADLKRTLNQLNSFLQATYYFEKSRAAYGFILGVRNDDDRRNVLTNARKHRKRDFLLNIDLKDFFHSVTTEQVEEIFAGKPFRFRQPIFTLLAKLATYNGRLPMGTSTSPVLSNFACRELDQELIAYAEAMLWVYTRYADDMTFSARRQFDEEKVATIRGIITKYGFKVNERKVKLLGKADEKIVTGLLVADTVTLAPGYMDMLGKEITNLGQILKSQNEQGQLHTRWVEKLKQQVKGRINFASFVLKGRDERMMQLKDAYYTAINPPEEDFGAVNWRSFPYNM